MKSTTYLIWEIPHCNGENPEWINLTRSEFLAFVKSPESKGRYFERLGSTNADGSDGRFIIETTESRYRKFLKEKRHKQYLRDCDPDYTVISYHGIEFEDEDMYGCFCFALYSANASPKSSS